MGLLCRTFLLFYHFEAMVALGPSADWPRFDGKAGDTDSRSAARRSRKTRRQILIRSLLVPDSAIRSVRGLAPTQMLGELDAAQHRNFERKHKQQQSPDGMTLTMHDRDVIIDI